ncbi:MULTISPECIES: AAA family ATPase [unclassified Modestobacter]
MFIRSLLLQRYGSFTDRLVDFGPGSLSLVVGPNETGKSTSLDALSDLLWGIPTQSPQAFRHGRPSLALEAALELPGEERVEVRRRSTGLTHIDTGADVPPVWQTGGDSRARWRESFGLSHAQLREGGRLLCEGSGDLAELVFTARSGRAVRELLTAVEATADGLYKEHRGNRSVAVRQALADYEEARARAKGATAVASQVAAATEAAALATSEVRRAERWVQDARAALAEAEQRQRAAPDARRLADARAQAAAVHAAGTALDPERLVVYEQLRKELDAADQSLAALEQERADLTARRAAVVVEDAVLTDAEQIRALHLEAEARAADGRQARQLAEQVAELDRQVGALVAELVGDTADRSLVETLAALHVPADRIAQLDALAAEVQQAEQRLAARDDALRDATRRLAEAGARGPDLDLDAVAAVREAHEAIEAGGSAVAAQRAAVAARAEALRRRAESLRLAGLPAGAAVPVDIPSTAAIRSATEELGTATTALTEADGRLRRGQAAVEETRRLLTAEHQAALPEPEDLAASRARRDAAVTELIAACRDGQPTGESTGRVLEGVAAADAVADLLLAHADAVARRSELIKVLREREAECAAAVEELAARTEHRQSVVARWAALWPGLGTAVPSPADAAEVRRHLDDARAAGEESAAADDLLAGLQQQVDAQVGALSTALARAGRPRPDADLDGLQTAARALLAEADAAAGRRAAIDELRRTEEDHRRERDDAGADELAVRGRWRELLAAAGVPDDLGVVAWHRRRDLVGQAHQRQREADGLRRQADEAGARARAFGAEVVALARRYAVPTDDPTAAIGALSRRREVALAARRTAEDLDGQVAGLRSRVDDEEAGQAAAWRALDEQRASVGAVDVDELAMAAQRGRRVAELGDDAERFTDLIRAAAPDLDLDALVEEHAGTEPEVLAACCEEARAERNQAEDDLQTAVRHEAEAKQRQRELTTGDGAAVLHARAQERLADVGERVERYLVARIQAEVLRGELEAYQRKHASPLLDEAGKILQRLSDGRYVALGVAHRNGGRGLAIVGADEEQHTPDELSEGTADQVFLALRLAGIASLQRERVAAGAPTLPVVLDDVLMTFDDGRATAALRVMAELSRQWQVIVFSHHAHLAALAESLSLSALTVAHLAPPPDVEARRSAEEVRIRARTLSVGTSAAPTAVVTARPSRSAGGAPGPGPTGVSTGVVREWARSAGYDVGERGRIPAEVWAAYEQAHR